MLHALVAQDEHMSSSQVSKQL